MGDTEMGSLVLLVLISIISSGNTAPKWTPDLAPEVKEATLKFFDKFNFAEKGGLAELQPKQIPNFYIADIAPVAEARKLFLDTFADHEVGKHADLAPVNTDVQAPQIANSYLADTTEVREAREMHQNAINMVEAGQLAQPVPFKAAIEPAPETDVSVVEPVDVKSSVPVGQTVPHVVHHIPIQ